MVPASGLADTVLNQTADSIEKLRVGSITLEKEDNKVVLKATARYKPEDSSEHETDRWGYTETDLISAMEFHDLSEMEKALIKEFVPLAVENGGGFANFRETATKTKSLIDRLEALTLPKLDDVRDGLKKYLDVKERAEELEEKIEETDQLIDEIVYDLYGLTDEEIKVVEEAVE